VKYCSAFYTGMGVVIMKNEGEEFMKKHKIESRINKHTQEI
jgi:hypothetical protein